jgi:cytochrome c-type biogenesis protein CcmH/NrfF
MSVRIAIVLLVALVLVAPAPASERRPTLPELEHEVMCPTCKTLLELSHAPVAERMRAFIRRRVAAGDTKSEIKTRLVVEFGEAVLAAPRTRGFGLLAWVLPFVALLGAGAAIGLVAWRWTHAGQAEAVPAGTSRNGQVRLDPGVEHRLDEELARFDG